MAKGKVYETTREMLLDWIQWHKDAIVRLEKLLEKY
ncbi:hypothetical protein [Erwinia phage Pecta]|nr:hypothetical protein [Erwinia phage Pecta]